MLAAMPLDNRTVDEFARLATTLAFLDRFFQPLAPSFADDAT